MKTEGASAHQEIRDAVRALCAQYPDEYFRKIDEARAYLAHPRLGPRFALATRTVMAAKGATLEAIFGPVDAIKFRSSMTLFTAVADEDDWPFPAALAQCCGGMPDEQTVALLRA